MILKIIDFEKIGKGALIAVSGCLLSYFTTVIANIDWSSFDPQIASLLQGALMAGWSVIVNTVRKWIKRWKEEKVIPNPLNND